MWWYIVACHLSYVFDCVSCLISHDFLLECKEFSIRKLFLLENTDIVSCWFTFHHFYRTWIPLNDYRSGRSTASSPTSFIWHKHPSSRSLEIHLCGFPMTFFKWLYQYVSVLSVINISFVKVNIVSLSWLHNFNLLVTCLFYY